MNLNTIKEEVLSIVLASKIVEQNEVEVGFSPSQKLKYNFIINKVKKNKAKQNSYHINGFVCVDIESNTDNNFVFLGKMLSRWTAGNEISTIAFSSAVKIAGRGEFFNEQNYLKCNFKGSILIDSKIGANFEANFEQCAVNNLFMPKKEITPKKENALQGEAL